MTTNLRESQVPLDSITHISSDLERVGRGGELNILGRVFKVA
ncbi:MAG: hypothetical protein ACJAR2_000091 [Ilumatobacter sp.]|jgi:hypothetical protein